MWTLIVGALLVVTASSANAQQAGDVERGGEEDSRPATTTLPTFVLGCHTICWNSSQHATCWIQLSTQQQVNEYRRLFPGTIAIGKTIGVTRYNNVDVKVPCGSYNEPFYGGTTVTNYYLPVYGRITQGTIFAYGIPNPGGTASVAISFNPADAEFFPDTSAFK
jgi:hypothetical protein